MLNPIHDLGRPWRRTVLGLPASFALGASLTLGAPAQAGTVLTGFQTTGADMAGAKITANFLGGGSQTLTWQRLDPTLELGGVTGSGWFLGQTGDSFLEPWILSADASTAIASLVIDLIPGNAVFDTIALDDDDLTTFDRDTPGSFDGLPFTVLSGGPAPTSFSYSQPVDISLGDLFGTLTLNWASGFSDGILSFSADSDSGTTTNPVTIAPVNPVTPPTKVSEPLGWMGLAIAGGMTSLGLVRPRPHGRNSRISPKLT